MTDGGWKYQFQRCKRQKNYAENDIFRYILLGWVERD